jgi:hypothetical protein
MGVYNCVEINTVFYIQITDFSPGFIIFKYGITEFKSYMNIMECDKFLQERWSVIIYQYCINYWGYVLIKDIFNNGCTTDLKEWMAK